MPDLTTPFTDIWAPYVKDGEKILWQGRPSGAFHMRRGDVWNIFGGIAAMLVTAFMAIVALSSNAPLVFKIFFGAIVLFGFLYALYMATFQFYFAAVRRGKTHYAITNQRAMALTTGRKEKFEDEVLDAATNLDYVPGEFASIYYKKTAHRKQNSHNRDGARAGYQKQKTTYSTRYTYEGFELIPDGAIAYQTMLKVIGAKLANPSAAKASKGGEAWQDFLFEGEELLWEGAPATGPRPTKFGIVFTVLGALIMYIFGPVAVRALSSSSGSSEVLIIGGLAVAMFALGLWMAVGIWLLDIRKRKATRYALTNRRAFVASALAGRKMLTYAIKPHYRPLLLKGWMDEVTFGEEDWFDPKTGAKTKRAISFTLLKDGQEVYDIITKVSTEIDTEAQK